ncbi:putative tyrosinase-like protein tyr-3 [Bulinus truncatus]|nr:putative tyrosinase-like protein tyr-3 [Bulinus truncatus]
MLTLDERRRYHDAVNALKRNTTFRPNVYDYIANVHGAQVRNIAHKGPGFLGWHRIYLRLYEYALQAMDTSVCLPYWDSTLDRQLTNPFLSSIWSSEFLGTPRGEVVDGPFANWRLQSGNKLIRNVGVSDDLLITDYVSDILSRNRAPQAYMHLTHRHYLNLQLKLTVTPTFMPEELPTNQFQPVLLET